MNLVNLYPCHRGLYVQYEQENGDQKLKEIQAWAHVTTELFPGEWEQKILPMIPSQKTLVIITAITEDYQIVTEQDMIDEIPTDIPKKPNTL